MLLCCILLCRLRLYSYSEVLFFCCISQLWDLYHSNINQPNLYQNYLKMSKEHYLNSPSSLARKKYCKSTDLKRRLFEVGIVHHPNSFLPPPIFNSTLTEHLKRPYDINKPLKYHPSNSPTIHKHNSKDFQIRKSPKQVGLASSKSKDNMSVTMSKFSKADAVIDSKQLKSMLINLRNKEWSSDQCRQESQTVELKLDEYVNLILRGAEHIDQFLYLVRGAQENIYQLNLVNFQYVRLHEGQPHFQYYTVSKKGFCQYIGGKPQTFLQLLDWSQQKQLYLKIKALKFFYRFRRWKTLQMWRRTVIRQRREIISHNLSEKMFLLEPITRRTLLELRKLTIAMEHSVLIIARNQGTYSLESFKHCQEKARREASLAVEEYSRQSRAIVRKCFENRLAQLRQNLKKSSSEEKTLSGVSQSPKEGAFQALGFPSKMTYEHRSRLRKQAGKFLRFSFLIDSLNLSSLTDIYATQVSKFIGQLELSQYQEGIKLREGLEVGKEEAQRQKMFIIQLMCNFKEVPSRLKTTLEQEEWSPFSNIRLKQEESVLKQFVSKLSDHWLSLQPNFDQILDELGFLLKEGLGSLKCFERWSRHREMQKYVSILQQWDDFVSDNWQVSQNDNLDPLILLDSIDPSLKKLKEILKFTEKQFVQYIREVLNKLLNSYWQYTESSLHKLYDHSLLNPSDTFENILTHTTFLHEQLTHKVPHRLQLGLFTIQITKLKNILGQKFASVLQNLRRKLPELVEQRTAILNQWFTIYGSRLKEEILNIDDFVKIVDVLKDIDQFSSDKREECNEMAQTYQIMQHFKIDTRKRKDFQSVTLKLKDQLDQLIITAEQNIERKTDVYSREVLKYHLPSLAKDISKALEKVEQSKFLLFSASQAEMLEQLETLKRDEEKLFQQNERCQKYICALKLQPNVLEELNTLSAKINSRIKLWKSLSEWQAVSKQHEHKNVKEMPLKELINTVNEFKNTSAQLTEDLPANEVLQYLSSSINQYAIYLPMLLGFNEQLSQSHWAEIYAVLPEKYVLDLKRREFSMGEFLRSGIGGHSYAIKTIFQRCKIEFKLQKTYQQLQESWGNISARTKVEGRFSIIANPEDLRAQINQILISITQLISNQYAQSLRQYSITYESMLSAQENLETWIRTQEKMVEIDRQCRVLDMKKLADYNYFQNAERAYKQISKPMLSKGAESGVRLNKLLAANMEEKFAQINSNLQNIEANIDNILEQHKRAFPSFLLFSNKQLLSLITDHSDHNIEWAARALVPFISHLQFENERITSIVSMDQDKLIKNPISTNSDIEQILYQIVETTAELNRKSLKSCKYKAIENNLSSLVEHYNIQHLLAISRVDFSYYTTISIENQVETADSLSQFRKVMRKDTMEEMKGRVGRVGSDSGKKSVNWIKYDSLLLQQLFYQQVLEQLIRKNVQRCEEFQWALQLKFYWEDNNSEESNITIRQLHLNLKYGNQFIGSQTKVIIQNEPEALLGLKLAQNTLYNASINTAERLLNAAGYKLNAFPCSEETCWLSIRNFIIGSHFADFVPFLLQADLLSNTALNQLSTQKWLEQFKENTLKKNSPYLKEAQRITAVYFNVRQNNIASPSFQGLMRVVNYNPLKTSLLLCYMRLFGIYSQQKTRLLLSLFESAGQLQQKGRMKNISLQQFLDSLLCEEQPNEDRIFSLALSYLKCKVNPETYAAIQKQLECLGVLAMQKWGLQEESKAGTLVEGLLQRRMVIVSGRGQSKKWFVGRELSRRSMKMIQIFGKNIDNQSLINQDVYAFLQDILKSHSIGLTESAVLYFEAVSLPTLHAFEKLVYGRQDIKQRFMQSSIYILIDLSTLQAHINPKLMTSFAIFNYEESKDYIHSFVDQKLSALEEESRRSVEKVILEIVLPTIETLNPKDQLAVEQKVISFLSFLFTLIPFTNPLEACLYSLIQTYKSSEEEQIKLQHILKKYIGEERLAENNKITQFLYSKEIPAQGLITQQQFLSHWLDNNQRNLAFNQYVITPEIAHLLHTLQNINTHTHFTPIIEGTSNTGKSTIFNLFRSINHQNTFFMHIVAEGSKWNEKLSSSLQRHGLNILGAKVTFMQTLIMVDDVHLADKHSLIPLEYMINYNRCNIQQQQFTLKKVRFALSSSQTQTFKGQKYLRIFLNGSRQKVHGIFVAALRQSMGKEWSLQDGLLKRMVEGSMQLCRKVLGEKEGQCKIAFLILKRVIGGFKGLKIKESGFEKQIEKYWAFSLRQALKSYSEPAHLEQELYKMDLSSYSLTPLSYTHLTSKPTEKKVEFLKDSKRLYNMLNEKIEKYNEGQIKRYGENFEFLNFDSVIEKIVTISHSLLLGQDHFLVGRKGSGKESLVKLSAYLNGMLYRHAAHSLKQAVIDILNNHSSPHIFYKQLHNQQDVSALQQYMCADFQSEILAVMDNRPKSSSKDKERMLPLRSTHIRNTPNNQYFTTPKTKLTLEEVLTYKKSFRIIVSTNTLQNALAISPKIRAQFYLDLTSEVPIPSILQYNEKLLAVDGVNCAKSAHLALSEIYDYSREHLGISLRGNDDCVRIFSSFLANLISEMTSEAQKYKRVLCLFNKLNRCCLVIQDEVGQLHSQLKELLQSSEVSKEGKMEIEWKLRQKSTCLSVGEKLCQILGWVQSLYTQRQRSLSGYLSVKQNIEITFAVTASYFIYLSNISYEKRQRILHQWYQNISILANKTPITSFLPIFLLYEQEFNTDSVDNLPDFYENMAIIFHSAKPIAIRDATLRGRQWLIKNCSFLYLREDQKDFLEILAQSLTKSSNIIIEVNSQQTMEHLLETVIGTLLFLPQDVSSVSISGQQINVHSEAKVYLLVDKKVKMPKDLQVQFTVVLFDQSQQLIRAILTHDYLTATQRDPYSLKLEIHNRIRTLKLQCQNFITQIAENIYEQLCPNQQPPQEQLLSEKLNQINDKLMIKIQNQFTKIKEKEELIRDLQEKYEKNELRINYAPTEIFLSKVNQIRQVLITLSSNPLYGRYSHFEFHSYFQTIKSGLSKGFIQNIPSLFLFSLRHWGGCYRQKDYVIFAVMLLIVWRGGEVKEFVSCLTEEALRTGLIMTFLGKSRRIFHNELQIETAIVDYFHQQLAQDQLAIHLFLPYQHNIFLPLVWPTPAHNHRLNSLDNHEEMSKVLRILSQDEGGRVKEKLLSLNLGIVWANGDEGVESLVKKNRGEDWLVLVHDEDGLLQTQKLIKGWFLGQKSLIFVHNNGLSLKCDKERFFWEAELDNQQTIFHKVLQICKRQRSSESLEKANEQADHSLRISQRTSQTQVQASPDYASTNTPMEANNTQIEPSKDNYLILLSQLNHFMQREYEGKGLKVFEMKENQMVLIRKAFQNSQNPLGMQEKIDYCFRYIERLFIMPFKEIRNHFSALKTSIYKSLQKQTSEQPFFQEAAALLAQTTTLHLTTESNILKTQLGWLINTRKLFNLNNEVIIQKFITKVNSYAAPSYLYTATPTINRSNKKPALLKAKRQSLAKKNVRESYSLGKKGQLNKILEVKCFNSLARLQILKEQEHYDQILQRIYKELDIARKELLCIQSQGISGSTLDLLAHLNQNTPLPSWKLTLAPIADGLTLTNHIQDLLLKRNQLYTYHTKFHLQDFAEIDLKNFKQPAHFISAYCRCEQNQTYVLTTSLTQEEVEKKNYLKVNGLWAWNWRFSSEGILESLSDNKFNLLVGCYLLEKSSLGTYTSGVDLFGSVEEGDAMLRVHVASKKTSVSQVNRVYLKLQV